MNPVMVEPTMYFAIGFFLAALLALPFVPLIHHRAVRLTNRRLDEMIPSSVVEIRADRDQLRAQFAVAMRKLEIHVDQLKGKTAAHLVEIQKRGDVIGKLTQEFGEKNAAFMELQQAEQGLRDRLSYCEDQLEETSTSLRKAEQTLLGDEQEKAKLVALLSDTTRLLQDREIRIEQLEDELNTARDTMADLRSEAVAAHRWLADNLHSDINRLQAELTAAVQTRSRLKRDIARASQLEEPSWEPEFEMAPAVSRD
jgi:chromosome segregation ATPase